ncbi:MAG: ArsR family transcriptional regulator [Syntrophaceae bacterium]
MTEAERITPEDAYSKVKSGEAILVCAYNDDEAFKKNRLEGAISYGEFSSMVPALAKDREIIFYCA